jgi:hypothetical protein
MVGVFEAFRGRRPFSLTDGYRITPAADDGNCYALMPGTGELKKDNNHDR